MKWYRPIMMVLSAMTMSELAQAATDVLCTTFPIYQITRNVVQGRDGVNVERMLPASLGCPHHYSLTPQDMRKLASAEVLVINGLGLEDFLGAPVMQANPQLRVVDSSKGIEDLLQFAQEPDEGHDHGEACDHEHHQQAANPHLFASPRMAALLAGNIAAGLSKADPEGAGIYCKNATVYTAAMNALADEMAAAVKTLRNNRIIQPHGIFDYLARDIGLEIVAVTQPHGQEPSAAEMLNLVETIRAKKAGVIFTEPQYSPKVGQTLAREAGISTAVLDPVASGPDNAPLNHYQQVMRKNAKTIQVTLGVNE